MVKWNSYAKIGFFVKRAKLALMSEDSVLYCFVGRRRSGKSMNALFMAKLIDPDFSIDKVCFTSEELMEKVKEYTNSAIVYDEAAVTAYSRDFMTKINKALNKTLQVFGYRRLAIMMTLQYLPMLDIHSQLLTDVVFRCHSSLETSMNEIDFNEIDPEKINLKKIYWMEPFKVLTDWLEKAFVTSYKIVENGRQVPIGSITMPELDEMLEKSGLSKRFLHEYQRRKEEFFESDKFKHSRQDVKLMEQRNRAIKKLYERGMKQREIAELFGIAQQTVSVILNQP